MNQVFKIFLRVFPLYLLLICIVTFGLHRAYFEQDEWAGFSSIIHFMTQPWWHIFIPFEMHFSPIPTLIWRTMYQVFKLQSVYYYAVEFIIHAAVSTFVYIVTTRLTKNSSIGMMTGLLFLLNSRAHQAFTHLAIFNSTDTCMFFISLFYVYLTSITGSIISIKQSIILACIFLAAVFTREEGYILIPTFIAYIYCFDREKINLKNFKAILVLALSLILFLFGRYYAQTLRTESTPVQYQINAKRAAYNLATIPIKLIDQNIIYYAHIANFFLKYYEKFYPGMIKNFYTDNAPLMDVGFFYLFGIFATIFSIWVLLIRPKNIPAYLIFFGVWICAHAFMLSFVGFPIFVLEPRYLYFSAFPVFCMVSIMLYTTFTFKTNNVAITFFAKIIVLLLVSMIAKTSYVEIRKVVTDEIRRGEAKTKVLTSLHQVHPKLADNTIFFLQCTKKCYRNGELGFTSDNVLPFPSGPGMILLISYAVGHESEWGPFFTNGFLFDTYAEDYKQIGKRSYGYFVTKSKLEDTIQKYSLSKDIVTALEYNEENYTLKDISESFRKTLN